MIPQLLLIALFTLALGIAMAQNGQEKKGKESFVATLIALGLQSGLLYWGGFFDELIARLGG